MKKGVKEGLVGFVVGIHKKRAGGTGDPYKLDIV